MHPASNPLKPLYKRYMLITLAALALGVIAITVPVPWIKCIAVLGCIATGFVAAGSGPAPEQDDIED